MPNPICHFELMVKDQKKARAFYNKIFDWTFDDKSSPEYTMIATGAVPGGGMMIKPATAPCPSLNVYFSVASIDGTLRNVVENGGKVIVPKTEVRGNGHFAMFTDPDQIPVGIFEEPKK